MPMSTSTLTDVEPETTEDQKKDKRDQPPKVPERRDEPREPIKISFEKVHTPGHVKRQAPPPPMVVLSKVFGTTFSSQDGLANYRLDDRLFKGENL